MKCAVSTAHPLMCHIVSGSPCSIRLDIQGRVSALCLSACHLTNQDSSPTMVSKPPMCRHSPAALLKWYCKYTKQHQAILCRALLKSAVSGTDHRIHTTEETSSNLVFKCHSGNTGGRNVLTANTHLKELRVESL